MPKSLVTSLIVLLIVSLWSGDAFSQVYAPDSDWAGLTEYSTGTQDLIYVFFVDNDPWLRAQFSDSSASTYQWYKYDSNVNPTSDRFQLITGQADSLLLNIEPGGYKVEINRTADDSTEFYVVWVMVDDVKLSSLTLSSNTCQALELFLSTSPNSYDINSKFTYFDLSSDSHHEKVALPNKNYFSNHVFESLNPSVEVTPTAVGIPYIDIEFENEHNGKKHGPLFDAAYRLTVTNPFGRGDMVVESDTIPAIATKVGLDIYFNTSIDNLPVWDMQNEPEPNGEALLEMKLESTAENADSLFWNIINDELLFKKGADSIVWRDKSIFDERIESFPPKEYMVPGLFGVEHVSKKTTSHAVCMDTILLAVEVDTSFIKPESIPNVFTPNNDGMNDFFTIKEIETNVKSIKSFQITILSRWGNKVYKFSGNPKEWEGWNGKINGDGKDVDEGVYFYVIEAIGWDGRRYKGGVYKGFLHLYR
ncbi:MAG: gliding motility-associated C-terminal domain-containing protein [Bacteroidales bacterium]|nr:gliding motility-associated C-terminal domain-containing protein [Bacteroidales bacterium]MDD3891823.1 gliding motility-associated C-terminal domain-containing protein [Bacteroidales bacterium]